MPSTPTISLLTIIFVGLLIATTLIRLWLGFRHIAHVQNNRGSVPVAFSGNITLDAHQKAADYTTAKSKLSLLEVIMQAALLIALTLGGGLQWLDDIWRNYLPNQEIIRGALLIVSAMLISSLIDLPFDYYKTFGVEEKFDFNRYKPRI